MAKTMSTEICLANKVQPYIKGACTCDVGHCRKEGELGNNEIAEVHKTVSEKRKSDVLGRCMELTFIARTFGKKKKKLDRQWIHPFMLPF